MRLISMSLWGEDPLYARGAVVNARLAARLYPGWQLRIYCSPEVPTIGFLRALGAEVCVLPPPAGFSGALWRFRAAADPRAEYVVFRDADSRLNVREKAAVDAWIASGRAAHVMRDHPHHRTWPLLGGMWGVRGGVIADMAERIHRSGPGEAYLDDMRFLAREVWPLIGESSLVHSSVPEPLGGEPFPPHPPYAGFVGEVVSPAEPGWR